MRMFGILVLALLASSAALRAQESVLDKLEPGKIPEKLRSKDQPAELVGILSATGEKQAPRNNDYAHLTLRLGFSADGKTLVSTYGGAVSVWDLSGSSANLKHQFSPGSQGMAVSPDGKTLAIGTYGFELWDLSQDGPPRKRCDVKIEGYGGVQHVAYAPDGKTLVVTKFAGTVHIFDLAGEKPVQRAAIPGHTSYPTALVISLDRTRAATDSRDNTIRLWDLGAEPKELAKFGPGGYAPLAFSPDGKTLVSGGTPTDPKIYLWDLASNPPASPAALTGHTRADEIPIRGVQFLEAGKTLVSMTGNGEVILWDVAKREKRRDLKLPATQDNGIFCFRTTRLAPDGRHLVAADHHGYLHVVRLSPPRK